MDAGTGAMVVDERSLMKLGGSCGLDEFVRVPRAKVVIRGRKVEGRCVARRIGRMRSCDMGVLREVFMFL